MGFCAGGYSSICTIMVLKTILMFWSTIELFPRIHGQFCNSQGWYSLLVGHCLTPVRKENFFISCSEVHYDHGMNGKTTGF